MPEAWSTLGVSDTFLLSDRFSLALLAAMESFVVLASTWSSTLRLVTAPERRFVPNMVLADDYGDRNRVEVGCCSSGSCNFELDYFASTVVDLCSLVSGRIYDGSGDRFLV